MQFNSTFDLKINRQTIFFRDDNGKYAASKMAIGTIVKSWPGLIRMCKPDGTGLQSLLGVLYLPNMETRVNM